MKEDHENAQLLYEGLVKLGFKVQNPQTNMLFPNSKPLNLSFNTIIEKINQMNEKEEEKIFLEGDHYEARLVIHHQISKNAIEKLLKRLQFIIENEKK